MANSLKSSDVESLSVWSCDPKDVPEWTPEDVHRLKEVLEKYIFEPNRQINEKIRTNTDT